MPTLSRFVQALVEYAEQQDEDSTLIIPEDLTTLSDEELAELHTQAVSSFDAIYGDGKALTADDVTVLSQITSGIEALQAESTVRAEAAAEREAAAAELASRIRPEDSMEDPEAEQEQEQEQDAPDAEALPEEPQQVAANPDTWTVEVQENVTRPVTGTRCPSRVAVVGRTRSA